MANWRDHEIADLRRIIAYLTDTLYLYTDYKFDPQAHVPHGLQEVYERALKTAGYFYDEKAGKEGGRVDDTGTDV